MNYFLDNQDLQFILDTSELSAIIQMQEDDYRQSALFDYAPSCEEEARMAYKKILSVAGDIAASFIAPRSERIDRELPVMKDGKVVYAPPFQECLLTLRQAELMGCLISRQYGGLNLPHFIFTMLAEIISQADASLHNIFALQGIAPIIETFAEETVKQTYLPAFAAGTVTGAMALTEAEAGSDLQNVKTRAEQDAAGVWRLSGVKRFITNGNAEVLLVLARSEPATTDGLGLSLFLCEGDDTVRVRRLEDKLGIHGSPTCELQFNNTRGILIGERQQGLVKYVLTLLNGARLATAAQAIGIAQAACNAARSFAYTRKQYGRRIASLPAIAKMLVDMNVRIEAARALTYEAARLLDLMHGTAKKLASENLLPEDKTDLRKENKRLERLTMLFASLAKYYSSEMSVDITGDALQVLGGSGYMRDYPVERHYRDARITTIYEGTSQLQIIGAVRGIMSGALDKYYDVLTVPCSGAAGSLQKKLQRCRDMVSRMVFTINSKKDSQLVELYARPLVDSAAEILMGYLLLRQARFSSRKLKIARLYINEIAPHIAMRSALVKQGDKTCIKDYNLIVGSAEG
jgi:hypothetical protein